MIAAVVIVVTFAAMELVSYATHRWLMHGKGMVWHRSHHGPPQGRVERNDLFPVCFSVVGVAFFAIGTVVEPLRWIGVGVTLYGVCYLLVREIVVHRRMPVPELSNRYARWVRESHRAHHDTGGEPYGMLLPLVRGTVRSRADEDDPLDRRARDSSRAPRARL
jgi:beta-carotene 3-hydroxylase